jgi:flagellar basal body-associated protein FliL
MLFLLRSLLLFCCIVIFDVVLIIIFVVNVIVGVVVILSSWHKSKMLAKQNDKSTKHKKKIIQTYTDPYTIMVSKGSLHLIFLPGWQ